MPENIEAIIVQVLTENSPQDRGTVHHRCSVLRNKAVPTPEFDIGIQNLLARDRIRQSGNASPVLRLSEPDFPETSLYSTIHSAMKSQGVLDQLKVGDDYVLQETATGGRLGTGQFSRPDFTLATIRKRRFDPLRHLDVITIEIKNRSGANLLAVHETLAHTRFSHYSFLACPQSQLYPEQTEAIQDACIEHKVGLILFDLLSEIGEAADERTPLIKNFRVNVTPERRSADPNRVEDFLTASLTTQNQTILQDMAERA